MSSKQQYKEYVKTLKQQIKNLLDKNAELNQRISVLRNGITYEPQLRQSRCKFQSCSFIGGIVVGLVIMLIIVFIVL